MPTTARHSVDTPAVVLLCVAQVQVEGQRGRVPGAGGSGQQCAQHLTVLFKIQGDANKRMTHKQNEKKTLPIATCVDSLSLDSYFITVNNEASDDVYVNKGECIRHTLNYKTIRNYVNCMHCYITSAALWWLCLQSEI